ncbi:MAG TPA: class I SAM-dependent methyltransferase [Candidatus Bathyarchaeia archaeon]|nr:class I SAM-dependent methyltransferase [Candidatus Bathyarchaeia archaeon]
MVSSNNEWDRIYQKYPLEELGWELGKPRPILREYVEKGLLKRGKALDICCGTGTNTVYLAEKGFEVTGIDISPTAIGYAEKKAAQSKVQVSLKVQDFLELPFEDEEFNFVFDMGCFHHVKPEDRATFINGVHRVLKKRDNYMLTCFSYKNGPAWNHFTRQQLIDLFSGLFEMEEFRHYLSKEGDGGARYFYTILMKKKE